MDEASSKPDLSSLRIDKDKKFTDRPRKRWWLWLVWIAIIVAALVAYFQLKDNIASSTSVKVGTARVISGSEASASLVATGYVVAQRAAEVASEGTGRLVFLGFEEGDDVKSGEVIAQLNNDEILAALDVSKAQLKQGR